MQLSICIEYFYAYMVKSVKKGIVKHEHHYYYTWQANYTLLMWCWGCGDKRKPTQGEVKLALVRCVEVHKEYVASMKTAKSAESTKAFVKGISDKAKQISWLRSQLRRK